MPQDPAQIQRQIEDTRAELAHTIDAIADIVSPKRAAKRGMNQVRARVEELRAQISGPQHDGQPQRQLPPGMSAELQGSTLYGTRRTVRRSFASSVRETATTPRVKFPRKRANAS